MGETARGGVVCHSREPVTVKITKYIKSEKGFLTIIVTNPIKLCLDNTSSYPTLYGLKTPHTYQRFYKRYYIY